MPIRPSRFFAFMKKFLLLTSLAIGLGSVAFPASPASAQVPNLINYQGRVAVGNTNFNGPGAFKFALVNTNGSVTYWSNDGSSSAGSQPAAAVALTVTSGLYSVLLGDATIANMTAVPASVFSNGDVRLRVWFNDGTNGFQQLNPDQRLAPGGYLPDGAVSSGALAANAVTSAKIASGAVGSTQLGSGAVTASNIAAGAVGNTQIASGVDASKLTLGTLPDQRLSPNVALLDAASNTFTGTLNVSTSFTVETRPNSTGGLNNFVGMNAGSANTTGTANTFVGHNSGKANVGGSSNSFYGLNAGTSNTSGQLNVFMGQGAGAFNDSGSNNNFIGQAAGFNAFNGNSNNFFGWHAGFATATGSNNAFFGDQAGASNTSSNNAYFGSGAGMTNTSGTQGSFFGINAGNKTTGSFNSFFGAGAGQFTTSGVGDTFVGNIAGSSNTTGSNNTFLGGNTGNSLTAESHNTVVGDTADGAAGITNATALGANAKVTASNSLVLGSINGTNGASSGTNVGIGTTAPNSTLQIKGSLSVAIRLIAATSLIGLTDTDYVLVVTGSGASTVGLPSPVAGRVYVIKNRATGLMTLGPLSGGATIDGNTTIPIAANIGVAQVVSDGTNWFTIN
jgi:hypothetical protein